MGKKEILDYVMNTPGNTNRAVLNNMLNSMEGSGGASGTLVIGGFSHGENNNIVGTSDKTWREIDTALAAGVRCVVVTSGGGGHRQLAVEITGYEEGKYGIIIGYINDRNFAETTSVDGYPSTNDDYPSTDGR